MPSVIIQPKRILIKDFYDDEAQGKFIRFNTITDHDMFFNLTKEWVSLYETEYKGEPVLAIPRRFPLEILSKFVNLKNYIKDKPVLNYGSRNIINDFSPKSDDQKEIIDFLLGLDKYSKIKNKPRRGLFTETGSGKTFSTLKAIATESHFAFINCPDDKAILTWKQEIAKFTDILPEEIAVIVGRKSLDKIVEKKEQYKLVLGSSKTFSSLIASSDYAIIDAFFNDMEFSLIAHDESHLNLTVAFILEMITQPKRTYYLTATPGRRLYKESKLLENMMPSDDCIFRPDPVPRFIVRECVFYSNPQSPEHTKGVNKPRSFDYLHYSKHYLLNEKYPYKDVFLETVFKRILKAARKSITDKKLNKIAIVCKTKKENDLFAEYVAKEFPDLTLGVFNSDIEDMDERYEQTNAQIIITTDKSFAGIINIIKLEAIILLFPISSEQHLLQIAGRIRREPNKKDNVYIIADFSFKRISKTLYNAKRILEPYSLSYGRIVLNTDTSKATLED